MIVKDWKEHWPEIMILGVEHRKYIYPAYRPRHDPESIIEKITPSFEGEVFTEHGYQEPRYITIPWLLEGRESLKFIKGWPAEERREAGRFIRGVWRGRRQLKERGLL